MCVCVCVFARFSVTEKANEQTSGRASERACARACMHLRVYLLKMNSICSSPESSTRFREKLLFQRPAFKFLSVVSSASALLTGLRREISTIFSRKIISACFPNCCSVQWRLVGREPVGYTTSLPAGRPAARPACLPACLPFLFRGWRDEKTSAYPNPAFFYHLHRRRRRCRRRHRHDPSEQGSWKLNSVSFGLKLSCPVPREE